MTWPTAMAATPDERPETTTGVIEHAGPLHDWGPVIELFPSWPSVLIPQHSTDPPINVAQANPTRYASSASSNPALLDIYLTRRNQQLLQGIFVPVRGYRYIESESVIGWMIL